MSNTQEFCQRQSDSSWISQPRSKILISHFGGTLAQPLQDACLNMLYSDENFKIQVIRIWFRSSFHDLDICTVYLFSNRKDVAHHELMDRICSWPEFGNVWPTWLAFLAVVAHFCLTRLVITAVPSSSSSRSTSVQHETIALPFRTWSMVGYAMIANPGSLCRSI